MHSVMIAFLSSSVGWATATWGAGAAGQEGFDRSAELPDNLAFYALTTHVGALRGRDPDLAMLYVQFASGMDEANSSDLAKKITDAYHALRARQARAGLERACGETALSLDEIARALNEVDDTDADISDDQLARFRESLAMPQREAFELLLSRIKPLTQFQRTRFSVSEHPDTLAVSEDLRARFCDRRTKQLDHHQRMGADGGPDSMGVGLEQVEMERSPG